MKNSKSTLFFTPGRNLLLQINRFACGELVHFCNLAVPSVSIESAVEILGHAHFRSDIANFRVDSCVLKQLVLLLFSFLLIAAMREFLVLDEGMVREYSLLS